MNINPSRRDFLKLTGLGLAGLFAPPLAYEYNKTPKVREDLTDAMLIEIASTGLHHIESEVLREHTKEPIPEKNDHFRFADEILGDAMDLYKSWQKQGYDCPDLFFEPYAGLLKVHEMEIMGIEAAADTYQEFMKNNFLELFSSHDLREAIDVFEENSVRFWRKYPESTMSDFYTKFDDRMIHAEESTGVKAFTFSNYDTRSAYDFIVKDPGTGIVKRVLAKRGKEIEELMKNGDSTSDLYALYIREQIDPIWEYLEGQVERRGGSPIEMSDFLAYLFFLNKGDVFRGMADALAITRLQSRNDKDMKVFNNLSIDLNNPDQNQRNSELILAGEQIDQLTRCLHDQASINVSANWTNEHIRDEQLFAIQLFDYMGEQVRPEYDGKPHIKLCDRYAQAGKDYHLFNIMFLSAIMEASLVPLSVMKKYEITRYAKNSIYSHGVDKIIADYVATMRSRQVQNILFSLPRTQTK